MRKAFINVLILGWMISLSSVVYADSVEDIQHLADTGAVNLAIRAIDREQLNPGIKPELWEQFERQRIALYQQRHDWEHINTHLVNLPANLSPVFSTWAKMQQAQALIELGNGEQARVLLRKLIWSATEHDTQQLSDWRRLILRSYLADGLAADAQTASLRYRQDYPEQAQQDYLLRARILLLNKQYAEAIELLEPHADDPTAGALLLLSQLRGDTRASNKVLQASYRHLREKGIDEEMTANLWAVASEAAERAGNRSARVMALEQVLVKRKALSLPKSIIQPTSDDLWNAYLEYAVEISNKQQLLIGQDDKWLALADSIKKKQPISARSLYAFVMLRGQQAEARDTAAEAFVTLLNSRKQGNALTQILFTDSQRFKERRDIPEPVRHKLVDLALADGDIDQASEIMATIQKPPPGQDQFMWWLRRARILVLGNQTKLGVQALDAILDSNPKMEQLQVDRFMQVIFDLQTAGENDAAYDLFAKLFQHTDDEKTQREIYYWMADSRKAQERYDEAAQLYLKSAMYPDPKNMDPWAQTAHYQAAVVLAKAGMYQDAKTLLEHLLKVTKDPQRREALQRELQKMWAMQ